MILHDLTNDVDAWRTFPAYRNWFNKLYVASFSFKMWEIGITGVPVPPPIQHLSYIVRPIYNLHGMGAGAYIVNPMDEDRDVPVGYFWSPYIQGRHFSIDYEYDDEMVLYHQYDGRSFEADHFPGEITKINKWTRSDYKQPFPPQLKKVIFDNCFDGIPRFVNIEYIVDGMSSYMIEVHFRRNTDFEGLPCGTKHIYPVWDTDDSARLIELMKKGNTHFKESFDDGNPALVKHKRLGFLYGGK